MKKSISILSILFIFIHYISYSQQSEKFSIQEVKQQCTNLALEKRTRISVTSFKVTTSHSKPETATKSNNSFFKRAVLGSTLASLTSNDSKATISNDIPPAIGENLSTMLTDALHEVNCFRVLESLSNNKELTSEIDAGNTVYSSKKIPKAGKQLGAQVVVTGEVIEYSIKDIEKSNVFHSKSQKFVKIGFNLKLVNPETRDIVSSKVFRAESKTNESKESIFRTNAEQDPAIASVMEDAIVQAVEYISKQRDSLHLTSEGSFAGNSQSSDGLNITEITLSNANYPSFSSLATFINNIPQFKSMEKSLTAGVGSYTVSHTGKTDDLLEEINKKLDMKKFEVIGYDNGKIEIKVKQ
jgi:curli biogenesis system outer membrane secretion channel CsgG